MKERAISVVLNHLLQVAYYLEHYPPRMTHGEFIALIFLDYITLEIV